MEGIERIAAKGRYGDNHLLHVSDAEVQGLNSLARSMYGHGLTTNPDTGLPEAFLFAPLLAPMLMGSIPALAGAGALTTGLVAGGLGAAEAAARGMDDPLQQGLMAGLTAGAGSAIGSSLQGAAEGAQAAQAGLDPAVASAATENAARMSNLGMDQALSRDVLASQYGVDAANMAIPQVPQGGAMLTPPPPSYNMPAGAVTPQSPVSPPSYNLPAGPNGVPLENLSTPAGPTPTAGPSPFAGMQKSFEGAKAIATGAPGAPTMGEFVKQNQMPLAIGAAGLGGQAQLGAQQEMREKKEAMDAEKARKLKETQDRIRQNYANVGRSLPTNPYTGAPIFAQGGVVGLLGGGSVGSQGAAGAGSYNPRRIIGYSENGTPIYEAQGSGVMFQNNGDDDSGFFNNRDYVQVGTGGDALTTPPPQVMQAPGYNEFLAQLQQGAGNKAAMAASGYTGQMPEAPPQEEEQQMARGGAVRPFDSAPRYLETGGMLGDGMSDDIPAMIDGNQPAALSDGEFVIPADVVSHLGNGSSDAGAQQLYSMMDRIRQARTGNKEQGKEINPKKFMPA